MTMQGYISETLNPTDSCSFADLLRKRVPVEESPKQRCKRWTNDEIQSLKKMFKQRISINEMCSSLDRPKHGVTSKIKSLGLKRRLPLTAEQEQFMIENYWLLGAAKTAKKIQRSANTVKYHAEKLGLKVTSKKNCNPAIPRNLLPYDMVKRVAILERDCPTSINKVDDSVVIFYDTAGPATPMMAMHLDELLSALEVHFKRYTPTNCGHLHILINLSNVRL